MLDRIVIALTLMLFLGLTALNIAGYFYPTGFLHIMHIQGIPAVWTR